MYLFLGLSPLKPLSLPFIQYILYNLFQRCFSSLLIIPELGNDISTTRIVLIYFKQGGCNSLVSFISELLLQGQQFLINLVQHFLHQNIDLQIRSDMSYHKGTMGFFCQLPNSKTCMYICKSSNRKYRTSSRMLSMFLGLGSCGSGALVHKLIAETRCERKENTLAAEC